MTRRNYIRIVSYVAFVLVVFVWYTISNTNAMANYKVQLENNYQQSLIELTECMDSVETNLNKCMYSNSSQEIYNVSKDLYAECSTAKNAISRLPVSQMELNNTYKFLSQAGDYALYIGDKLQNGEKITDEEHQNIAKLLSYAKQFSDSANQMVNVMDNGGKITENEVNSGTAQIKVSSLTNSFSAGEKAFKDYPTLLYDGPFADQVLNKKSELLKKSDTKTKDECKEIAAKAMKVNSSKISYQTEEKSNAECYDFSYGRYTISVTKQGGYIKSIIYSGVINNSTITEKNAMNIAREYLSTIGYNSMEESYFSIHDNICTINYAYCVDDVYYYSDLIKIGVSLSDGAIVSLDAKTYITNHKDRKEFNFKIKEKNAKSKLSKYLTVKDVKKCVIPKENGKEVDCWEFTCTSKDTGEDALIYINAQNGNEENIMLLLYSDNGTLVK